MPAALILFFARTRRWAIVASGTRNARAIPTVVESTQKSQRQRNSGLGSQRRVAAGEDQPQPVVVDAVHFGDLFRERDGGRLVLAVSLGLPPDAINRLATGRGEQPRTGAVGHAIARPGLEGSHGGF